MLAHALLRWRSSKHRVGALVLSVLGAVVNSALAIQLVSFWRVLKWESESEWEGTAGGWQVNSVKLVWGLLSAYFTTASVVCVVGAVGVIKVRGVQIIFFLHQSYLPEGSVHPRLFVSTEITRLPTSVSADS